MKDVAAICGVTTRTLYNWIVGKTRAPGPVLDKLERMALAAVAAKKARAEAAALAELARAFEAMRPGGRTALGERVATLGWTPQQAADFFGVSLRLTLEWLTGRKAAPAEALEDFDRALPRRTPFAGGSGQESVEPADPGARRAWWGGIAREQARAVGRLREALARAEDDLRQTRQRLREIDAA